jgi:hypothetical protein
MVNNKIGRIGEFQDLFNEKIYIYILFLWYIDLPYIKFKIKIDKFVLFFFGKKINFILFMVMVHLICEDHQDNAFNSKIFNIWIYVIMTLLIFIVL